MFYNILSRRLEDLVPFMFNFNKKSKVVVVVPHNGIHIPRDYVGNYDLDSPILFDDVDHGSYSIYRGINGSLLSTIIHRHVVDLNRERKNAFRDGEGVRKKEFGSNIRSEILARYFDPFWGVVNVELERIVDREGSVLLINGHTMESRGDERPDFCIGDNNGKICDVRLSKRFVEALKDNYFSVVGRGCDVRMNYPFKGDLGFSGVLGNPEKNRNALLVEINKKLYMDEYTNRVYLDEISALNEVLRRTVEDIV